MGIEFNLDFSEIWQNFTLFISQDPITMSLQLFFSGGWVVFLMVFIRTIYDVWLDARQGQYASKLKFVLLAVDIPKNNEQTPKAVENIFVALAGSQSSGNLIDRFWHGKIQESFSFEVVSLEGYIQFLIRTPVHFRDLVEAAIYAQYPEAEITEVEDYTANYKNLKFPDDKYNLWGTEFVLVKDYPYPIKTYPEFEHTLTQSFLDPMAGLLEILGRFGPGEQLWLQLVVTPVKPSWGEKAKKIIKQMKGETYAPPETLADKVVRPVAWASDNLSNIAGELVGMPKAEAKKKDEDQWKMFKLTPGERLVFERIQQKLSKIPFRAKLRLVYLGEKDVFNKGRGVAAVIGTIQQFNTSDANGFKPGGKTKTAVDYFRVGKRVAVRQNRILRRFIGRSNFYGENPELMYLSTEELASLWHFPVMTVKAPAVEKIASKRAVPPTRLPYDSRLTGAYRTEAVGSRAEPRPAATPIIEAGAIMPAEEQATEHYFRQPAPPPNLPTV